MLARYGDLKHEWGAASFEDQGCHFPNTFGDTENLQRLG